MDFDPALHEIDDPAVSEARIKAMRDMYLDAQEDLPPNAPEPRGNYIQVN